MLENMNISQFHTYFKTKDVHRTKSSHKDGQLMDKSITSCPKRDNAVTYIGQNVYTLKQPLCKQTLQMFYTKPCIMTAQSLISLLKSLKTLINEK